MQIFKRNADDQKNLQDVIDDLINQMSFLDKTTPEFEELMTRLERLQKLKTRSKFRIPPEVWVPSATTLLMAIIVINAEHIGPVTSKAFSFVPKPKI